MTQAVDVLFILDSDGYAQDGLYSGSDPQGEAAGDPKMSVFSVDTEAPFIHVNFSDPRSFR